MKNKSPTFHHYCTVNSSKIAINHCRQCSTFRVHFYLILIVVPFMNNKKYLQKENSLQLVKYPIYSAVLIFNMSLV